MTVTLYRVEDFEGRGPYNTRLYGEVYPALNFIDSGDKYHPAPWQDGIDSKVVPQFSTDYRHGFKSFDALLAWFHSCSLEALILNGFTVMEYKVPEDAVAHGGHQSVFRADAVVSSQVFIHSEDLTHE